MVLLIFYRPGKRVAGSFFILQANKQGEEVIWMGPSERRRAILEHLCQKRFDTTKNLAELFGVCERTIRNDLVVLTCSYPIETSFGPYGVIRVANWFHLNRHMLSFEQAELLRRIRPALYADDTRILDAILAEFAPKTVK